MEYLQQEVLDMQLGKLPFYHWTTPAMEYRLDDAKQGSCGPLHVAQDACRGSYMPKSWIIERTLAWLARDRDPNEEALGFLRLASIRLMLRKLCNPARSSWPDTMCMADHNQRCA